MSKYFVITTESDFSTLRRTVVASSGMEALSLCPTTGSYDSVVKIGLREELLKEKRLLEEENTAKLKALVEAKSSLNPEVGSKTYHFS